MVGDGIWEVESNGVSVRKSGRRGLGFLCQLRFGYMTGDVFWVGGGIESTPMYCLL